MPKTGDHLASVGLRVSGSHHIAGIAAEIAGKRWLELAIPVFSGVIFGDMRYAPRGSRRLALSRSHRWLHSTPEVGSSVIIISSEP